MSKVAVIFAPGFEEGEGLAVVDVMRRAEIDCDIVGLLDQEVMGAHDICVRADVVFDGSLDAYDMVVLPGGMGGALAMRDHEGFQAALKKMNGEGKLIAAANMTRRDGNGEPCYLVYIDDSRVLVLALEIGCDVPYADPHRTDEYQCVA